MLNVADNNFSVVFILDNVIKSTFYHNASTVIDESFVYYITVYNKRLISSSAIAERPRCKVGQFCPEYKWATIFCTKRCRCQKIFSDNILNFLLGVTARQVIDLQQ